ncbi:MAG TPA: 2Fe-2S iron-sulfur cluster-binding protein [Cyclobacteriaceae bacterium]|nr:2Fe-2S iron-sulfur cluster-binding protein [Cyclobacteriaceae bacterium]
MAVIVIKNLGEKTIEVQDFSKSILQHMQENGIDWMFACGGKGRCTTCKAIVFQGLENLEPKTAAELKYETLGLLGPNERLSCQTRIRGSVTISVPEEYKLPHMKYSD